MIGEEEGGDRDSGRRRRRRRKRQVKQRHDGEASSYWVKAIATRSKKNE